MSATTAVSRPSANATWPRSRVRPWSMSSWRTSDSLAPGSGQDGVGHHPTGPLGIAQLAGQPLEGDQQGYCGQAELQTERPGVAEPVAGAKPQERTAQQAPAAVAAQRPSGMVGRKLTSPSNRVSGTRPPLLIACSTAPVTAASRPRSLPAANLGTWAESLGCQERIALGPCRSTCGQMPREPGLHLQRRRQTSERSQHRCSLPELGRGTDGAAESQGSRRPGSDYTLSSSDPRHARPDNQSFQ